MTSPSEKIIDDFCEWATFRGLGRSPDGRAHKGLGDQLDTIVRRELENLPPWNTPSTQAYDEWHRHVVSKLMSQSNDGTFKSYGWAAKFLNLYIKARYFVASANRSAVRRMIHPVYDNGLQRGLYKVAKGKDKQFLKERNTIASIEDEGLYVRLIQAFDTIAADQEMARFELESLWEGARQGKGSKKKASSQG